MQHILKISYLIFFLNFISFASSCLSGTEDLASWSCGSIKSATPSTLDISLKDKPKEGCEKWIEDKDANALSVSLNAQLTGIHSGYAYLKHLHNPIPDNLPPFIKINAETKKASFRRDDLLAWFNDAPVYEARANTMLASGQSLSATSTIRQSNHLSGNYVYVQIDYTNINTGQRWVEANFFLYKPNTLSLSYSSPLLQPKNQNDLEFLKNVDRMFLSMQYK